MNTYYLSYVASQPVLCVLYPPRSPSPVWAFTSLVASPSLPLPAFHSRHLVGHRTLSSAPKPKPDTQAAESAALRLRPYVDPLIEHARPPSGFRLDWDLYHDPRTLRANDKRDMSSTTPTWADLAARPAARSDPQSGDLPLRSLVLVFRYLPLQIVVKPSHSSPKDKPPERGGYVSVWDVMAGLYDGLRAPVDPKIFCAMPGAQQETLLRSGARRVEALAEDKQQPLPHPLRNIDFLRMRRRFLGIRVAEHDEVPKGRRFGEVFVVEVGSGWI